VFIVGVFSLSTKSGNFLDTPSYNSRMCSKLFLYTSFLKTTLMKFSNSSFLLLLFQLTWLRVTLHLYAGAKKVP